MPLATCARSYKNRAKHPTERNPIISETSKTSRGDSSFTWRTVLSKAGDWICRCAMNIQWNAQVSFYAVHSSLIVSEPAVEMQLLLVIRVLTLNN